MTGAFGGIQSGSTPTVPLVPLARLALTVVAAFFFFVAGAQMREQGSGVDFSFGLLAYGAAFAVLAYGVAGLRDSPQAGPKPPRPPRSFYEDEA